MASLYFAMAGWAEGVAAMAVLLVLFVGTAAGLLVLAAGAFRSMTLAWFAVGICVPLGMLCVPAAFAPPPETTNPYSDALHWHTQDQAAGWYGMGLAIASVGCLGLVALLPGQASTQDLVPAPSIPPTQLQQFVWWGTFSTLTGVTLTGTILAVLNAPSCSIVLLLFAGVAFAGRAAGETPAQPNP